MLIKKADDQSDVIAELERVSAAAGPQAKQAAEDLRRRKAGIKGESESAYLIDFEFAASANWAVIHDLRMEHKGRVAQVDHLLINRWMDIYVLESKHFHAGLKITEDGEFLRYNSFRRCFEGMPSPIAQNERHIAVLRDVVSSLDWPMRMGMRIAPSLHSLILVAPGARIDRPKKLDTSRVIKADQLRARLWKDIDEENPLVGLIKTAAMIVSRETVELVAKQLVAQHKPLRAKPAPQFPSTIATAPSERVKKPTAKARAIPSEPTGPACKSCSGIVGEILHGRFGYYFKCAGCGGNTAIRFSCAPGHNPRLRKDGASFYRECAECGSSALFHLNEH